MNNETLQVIQNRTSLRVYDPKPLTQEEEDSIIQSALQAPTAGNQMLYSMIIIRDQDKKKKLSKLCDYQMFIQSAPFVVVFVADHHRWFDYYRMNGVKRYSEKHNMKFQSPSAGDLMLAIEDAMCAAQNSVIAAESLGIGSCYIGDILENYETIKELLELPEETFPIAMLCYGHYKEEHQKVFRKRFDRKYIVFEDSYKQLSNMDYEHMFEERAEREFLPQNKFAAKNYAQQFYARKTGASFSKEMNRSVKAALKEWMKNE